MRLKRVDFTRPEIKVKEAKSVKTPAKKRKRLINEFGIEFY